MVFANLRQTLSALSRHPILSHPLAATIVGFVLTGIVATSFTAWLTARSHEQDIQRDTRNAAIAAESEISELTSERREREALVASSINRNASLDELRKRKQAYDEAYVRWNSKIPGDILRFRAGFQLPPRSDFEQLVDGLTNVNILLKGDYNTAPDGLLARSDSCITQAYDLAVSGEANQAKQLLTGAHCNQARIYAATVACFSLVAETMYQTITTGIATVDAFTMISARQACVPPK